MTWIKQFFCRHKWTDITTEPNRRTGTLHMKCFKCNKIISALGEWELEGVDEGTSDGDWITNL